MAYLKKEELVLLPSPLTLSIVDLMRKTATAENVEEAYAGINAPEVLLNSLLAREVQFQESMLLDVVNEIGKELPHLFPSRELLRQLYDLASGKMFQSGTLKEFTKDELDLWRNAAPNSPEEVLEQLEDECIKWDFTANSQSSSTNPLQGSGGHDSIRCEIFMEADTTDVAFTLNDLTRNIPQCTFFMKDAVVEIEGRTLSNVRGNMKLMPCLNIPP